MDELRIQRVDRGNWQRWQPDVLHTMRRTFPRKLWWRPEYFDRAWKTHPYIARVGTINAEFAGFAFGLYVLPVKELGKIPPDCSVMHFYYMFIKPELQGAGHGFAMLCDFIEQSQKQRYDKLAAFVRTGVSLNNFRKLGANEVRTMRNFYGTGETYKLCTFDL